MKQYFLLVYAVLFAISCKQIVQSSRIPRSYTSEQLRNNLVVGAAGYNSDETKVLIDNNRTGIFNVYLLNIGDTSMQALTHSTNDSYFAVGFLPGTSKFIFTHDQGGNENRHLYLQSEGDSATRDLTPWPGSTNNFVGWSADKRSMYVSSNRRNPKFFDLWKLDTTSWKPVLLYQNDSGMSASLISRSERYLALNKNITTDKNELYLYDRRGKTIRRISNSHEAIWNPAAIEQNDSILYYTTNDGNEFTYLVRYNVNTGTASTYYKDKWDVGGMQLSEHERYHTIFVNEDGRNKILLYDHKANRPIQLPGLKGLDVESIDIAPSERNIILSMGSSTSPTNLYTYNITRGQLKQLTSTLNREVDENDLVKAEVIRFHSFDGKEIPAIYYKPLQASKQNKVGALVWVHGGPGGQSRTGFSNSIQFLVNHGYAVLAVNNRGSSGYGKTFYKLDNKAHGYGDLNDCIWAEKWLARQDYIDSNAIGIYGGSYGGNMVLNALCMHPDAFKVGVDLFGVANWMRTLKSIPPYWEDFKKALYDEMGDPYTRDSVLLIATSPLYNYQKIRRPLIVFQGANDVRVLKVESDEIVAGVRKNGVPVEYVVYPDEGHGFTKKEDLIETDKKTLQFLEKYMRPGGQAKQL